VAKGYWIPHLDVSNPQGFQAYRDTADAAHKRFGSKLLARGGRREVVEGKMRARNVLREFNTYDEALGFYRGPEYSKAHPLREPHSVCDFLIVEGYGGPQPQVLPTAPQPAARPGTLLGYWIAHIDVLDAEGYKAYQDYVTTPFSKFGARYLVRGGRCEVMEGRARKRCVSLEFPSYEAALACYRSPEYKWALELRAGKADVDLVVLEGVGSA
jgi:uncharacterized protein (DUF1330 family)